MVYICFSTTDEKTAFEHIKKALPEYVITREICEPLLKMVRDEEIRIGDPAMYSGESPIYGSTNYNDKTEEKVMQWILGLKKKEEQSI